MKILILDRNHAAPGKETRIAVIFENVTAFRPSTLSSGTIIFTRHEMEFIEVTQTFDEILEALK